MEVILSTAVVRVVGLDGLQAKWQIAAEDVVAVDDDIFVKLCAGNKQLCNLVWEDNDDAPKPEPNKHTSLTSSIGWTKAHKAQNDSQAQQLSGCSLFGKSFSAQEEAKDD